MTITLPEPISNWLACRARQAGTTPAEYVSAVLRTEMTHPDAALREAMREEGSDAVLESEVAGRKKELEQLVLSTLQGPPAEPWTADDVAYLRRRIEERAASRQG